MPQVGGFQFWFAENRWEWSDELAVMFGYAPGTVEPTTQLLLSHKHPEDHDRVSNNLAKCFANAEPFCSKHRIIDRAGTVRDVLVICGSIFGNGTIIGMSGFYIDITDVLAERRDKALDEVLPEVFDVGAVIEQAKGALMLAYGITAEQAFRVLRWRARETGCSVRDLASRLTIEMSGSTDVAVGLWTRFDHLLLTVHHHTTS